MKRYLYGWFMFARAVRKTASLHKRPMKPMEDNKLLTIAFLAMAAVSAFFFGTIIVVAAHFIAKFTGGS